MTDIMVVHSTRSGKVSAEEGMQRLAEVVMQALGKFAENMETLKENMEAFKARMSSKDIDATAGGLISFVSSREEIDKVVKDIITRRMPKVALSGGDGFASLFFNHFFRMRAEMGRDEYNPDVLFMKGGTGNAISYCGGFKSDEEGLRALRDNRYETEEINLLEVETAEKKELCQFTSFGADGEIIEIYGKQNLKGMIGYIWSVLKYSFSRKLYNPLSRNDANYDLTVEKDGEVIHRGRHEGGGISAIPYIGYGFRPYPLAVKGNAHIRFVILGAWLMPTLFKFTDWIFTNRPNRFIYDHHVDGPCNLDFIFSRKLHIQVSGDLWEKQDRVRVGFTKKKTVKLVKCPGV